MSGSPSRKRPRPEAEESISQTVTVGEPQRDEELWLSDGNVVVVAQHAVAFRVHKSLLAQRSEVFRDLFSLPSSGTEETLDGCPVVHLIDPPDDLRHLLSVLCCGKNYYYTQDKVQPVSVKVLAALIRMSHKYAIQDVLADALARLQRYYTANLAEWSAIASREQYVKADPEDAITVIELARLTDTPSLLPTAFLSCFALDGTTVPSSSSARDREHILARLAPEDLTRILRGRVKMTKMHTFRIFAIFAMRKSLPSAECRTSTNCGKAMFAGFGNAGQDFILSVYQDEQDDILLSSLSGYMANSDPGLCAKCRADVETALENNRRIVWEQLPDLFDLQVDGWPATGSDH
ncbi:hypothetical protein K466DRAFT_555880 [Polyporus arcularius HHB13444]|uniref:BTB domain-containing protein n=1 Tax=Polyporus arcularius HHB13444 TaxID=1314778 RepID=A0A5C3P0T6_9APHY|nr:hypothetical protein K466DRAFT_555880 [Polyporus arcularius HHB13444]